MNADRAYRMLIKDIIDNGVMDKNPRHVWHDGEPAHIKKIHSRMINFDLNNGELPFITLRPIPYKSAIRELFWIYLDQSNDLDLLKDKYHIKWWDDSDIGDRTIGSCYGHTAKRYNLLKNLIEGIKSNPENRTNVMDLWQYEEFMEPHGLKPCAFNTIFNTRYVDDVPYLDMQLTQRSCDILAGVPSNWVQYSILLCIVAKATGLNPGVFTWVGVNVHLYDRHIYPARVLMSRANNNQSELPKRCEISKSDIFAEDFTPEDIRIIGYNAERIAEVCPQIKFDVAYRKEELYGIV